jgi:hypothetical protein
MGHSKISYRRAVLIRLRHSQCEWGRQHLSWQLILICITKSPRLFQGILRLLRKSQSNHIISTPADVYLSIYKDFSTIHLSRRNLFIDGILSDQIVRFSIFQFTRSSLLTHLIAKRAIMFSYSLIEFFSFYERLKCFSVGVEIVLFSVMSLCFVNMCWMSNTCKKN